jgi:hypothetical protein
MKLGSRLIIGGIAGFVATMAMTAALRRVQDKASGKGKDIAPAPADDLAPDLGLFAHFAYGAACGALLAVANPRPGRIAGSLAGGGIWLASEMGWLPPLAVLAPVNAHPLRRHLVTLSAHVSWGASTAQAIRELGATRTAMTATFPLPLAGGGQGVGPVGL